MGTLTIMKLTKTKLKQMIKEELVTMTEGFGLVGALSAMKDAENQGIVDAQDDFMRSKRGEGVSPDLPSFGSAEEEEAYGMAWGKEWHRLMDNAVKNRVDMERERSRRELNRPPEPETDADREAAEAEFDFESTFSEGKTKITKTKLQQIIKEEYQRALNEVDDFEQDLYPGADERGDPDNWDHVYDDDNRYEGNITDEERAEFVEAYQAVVQLRRIKPTALPESVEDTIYDMLVALNINKVE